MSLNLEVLSRAADQARGLAIDAVHASQSGHLGLPLGCAEMGAVLYGYALKHNPDQPRWINRDYFILSAGHGSMFLYAWLNMSGYDLPMSEIKRFRQLHSKTPGHPEFFETLQLSTEQAAIADRILFEVRRRLRFLVEVGLDYLTLDRLASTLSGGEAQRIQLATNLGSSLVGALYVLDEPSIGLHPRDNDRLIRLLKNLRDIGNTVLVVEHDAEMMRSADHILDIGPAAGELGGRVMYEGDFKGLLADETSLTARYLRGDAEIKEPRQRRTMQKRRITVQGAAEHNLKSIDVEMPRRDGIDVRAGVAHRFRTHLVELPVPPLLRPFAQMRRGP